MSAFKPTDETSVGWICGRTVNQCKLSLTLNALQALQWHMIKHIPQSPTKDTFSATAYKGFVQAQLPRIDNTEPFVAWLKVSGHEYIIPWQQNFPSIPFSLSPTFKKKCTLVGSCSLIWSTSGPKLPKQKKDQGSLRHELCVDLWVGGFSSWRTTPWGMFFWLWQRTS